MSHAGVLATRSRAFCVSLLLAVAPVLGDGADPLVRAEQLLQDALEGLARGQAEEAVSRLDEARRIYEELGDLRGRAECLLASGLARTRLDTYGEAVADFEKSLELWRLLGDPAGEWLVHYATAEARLFLEDTDRALAAVEDASKLLASLEQDPARILSTESFRVIALAFGLPVEELSTVSALLPGLSGILADYLGIWTDITKAKVLQAKGLYAEAGSILEAARSRDERLGILSPVILDDLGEVFLAEGDLEKALGYFRQARDRASSLRESVRITLTQFGAPLEPAEVMRPYEVEALQHMAGVFMMKARYEEALDTMRDALAITRTLGLPLHQCLLIRDMGKALLKQGFFTRALSRFERSLEMAREIGSLKSEAEALNLISEVYTLQGMGETALRYQISSVETFQKMGHRADTAAGLAVLSRIYHSMSMFAESSSAAQRALAIAEEIGHKPMISFISRQEAWHLIESGDASEALTRAERSRALAQELGDLEGRIETHRIMAFAHLILGRPEEAAAEVDLGLGLIDSEEQVPLRTLLNFTHALTYRKLDLADVAEDSFLKTIAACRQLEWEKLEATAQAHLADLYLESGRKPEALALLEEAVRRLRQGRFQIQLPELAALPETDLIVSAGALLVDVYASRGDSETSFLHAERARAQALLHALGHAGAEEPAEGSTDLRRKVERLRLRLAAIEKELNRRSLGVDVGEWQRLRRERQEARDDFVDAVTELRLKRPEYASLVDTEDVATLAETRASLDEGVTLVAYYALDSRVIAWVVDRESAEMVDLTIGSSEVHKLVTVLELRLADRDFAAAAADLLYRRLFAPLETFVRHERLILVPHGVLHQVPFAALWNAAEGRFLAEDYAVTYAPSASILRHLVGKRSPSSGRLLALGNPDGSLPGAEAESEAVARIYGTRAHLRAEATESLLRTAAADGVDVLHVAAHANVDVGRPRFSHLALAPDDRHDGRLDVHELYWDVDLTGVDLVVLSACDTAKGRRSASEEILGLTRAFIYAGSPAVVTTQWPIDDQATRFLMEAFYRRLRAGASAADALRGAQLETLAREPWSSPYYWAAFTLNGDWKSMGGSS